MFANRIKYYGIPSVLFLVVGLIAFFTPHTESITHVKTEARVALSVEDQRLENLIAFTKLYGYVRYFHPSDEARTIYWNQFLYYGVEQVKNAKTQEELKQKLEELFSPIAPLLVIHFDDETPIDPTTNVNGQQNVKLIAWQHNGMGGGMNDQSIYTSVIVESENSDHLEVFDQDLTFGEKISKRISSELRIQLPLVLYKNADGTIGATEKSSMKYQELQTILSDINPHQDVSQDETVRIVNVAIAWNVFQHFYPYLDVVDVDWDKVLLDTLVEVQGEMDRGDFLNTMSRMLEQLQDGHAAIFDQKNYKRWFLPFRLDLIENEIVVINTAFNSLIELGDIILEIDGQDVKELLTKEERLVSGSKQWKRNRAMENLLSSAQPGTIAIKLQRNHEILDISVAYFSDRTYNNPVDVFIRPAFIEEIEENIYYVNMNNVDYRMIEPYLSDIAEAEGVIFDLRGYPKGDIGLILHHIIDKPINWVNAGIPQVLYPDQEGLTYYRPDVSNAIEPLQPKLNGKLIFLTYGGSISYAESIMGLVEEYQLAEIIGQPTAGANGNINPFRLIDDFYVSWTGMQVLKQDNSQLHLIGVQPTILVERTIEEVRAGRDIYMEKALEVIRNAKD